MADELKKKRTKALSKFTRNLNSFTKLLEDNSPKALVDPQYEVVNSCWKVLEDVHDDYLEATDEDIEGDGGISYLDAPGERRTTALLAYSAYLKAADQTEDAAAKQKAHEARLLEEERLKREAAAAKEAEEAKVKDELTLKFGSLKLEVESGVDHFSRLARGLRDSLDEASEEVKRCEWLKVESEFGKLKDKFLQWVSLDPLGDVTDVKKKFEDNAETAFLDLQSWVLPKLKVSSASLVKTSGGDSSSTRRERVKLPEFNGDVKASPFLKFPIWLAQWEKMIGDYEEKWWSRLLGSNLDEAALAKIVGYEDNYVEAMKQLKAYYGDPLKVVECVMREVKKPNAISDGDFRALVSYSDVLVTNFTRLKNLGLEHEMSNTSAMYSILQKFPTSVGEKWQECLASKSASEKIKPFPVFIEWMKTKKEIWEKMAMCDAEKSGAGRGGKVFFGFGGAPEEKRCHSCDELGHIKRNCPKLKNDGKNQPTKKIRRPPSVKKFWCALHKGDPGRRCFSDGCTELRKLEPANRVKLLKENGDCSHCTGDHKPSDCTKKDRVCGGRKDDRGCSKSHQMHELFCLEAKVFVNVQVMKAGGCVEGVLLSIMKVLSPTHGIKANVFWDLGSTDNFVCDAFAKRCGFKGRQENLNVTTLGDKLMDITVMTYSCALRDANGKLEHFKAYGMETITGCVSKIGPSQLKKLFPNMSDQLVEKLQRGSIVDVLIGICHPSWHPERVEKAKGGGDFWMFRGKFGVCVGGRYPGMVEGTKKNQNLFTVNKSFHILSSEVSPSTARQSHELEFCPKRVQNYATSCSRLGLGNAVIDAQLYSSPMKDHDLSVKVPVESHAVVDAVHCEDHVTTQTECTVSVAELVSVPFGFSVAESESVPLGVSVAESESVPLGVSVAESKSAPLGVPVVGLETVSRNSPFADNAHVLASAILGVDKALDDVSGSEAAVSAPVVRAGVENVISGPASVKCGNSDEAGVAAEPESRLKVLAPEVDVGVDSFGLGVAVGVGAEVRVGVDSFGVGVAVDGAAGPKSILNALAPTFFPSTVQRRSVLCAVTLAGPLFNEDQFFQAESLGLVVEPQCGGCKCSKCPVPGSTYSFKEQTEFDVIRKNLLRKEGERRWYTTYPWRCARSVLPKNDKGAMQNLLSLERSLAKNKELAEDFSKQIDEMVSRGAAVILSKETLNNWKGDYYYLPMVGVKGKKKWLRVCFDASRRQCGCPSLNDCLMKGPDRFLNNLLSVIMGFRNGRVGAVADISKFHNQVGLLEEDMHMQRFMWRYMDTDAVPTVFAVKRNNFGVMPANCIATCALHLSADEFADQYPVESREMKEQTYIDDQLVAGADFKSTLEKTKRLDEILDHAGMPNKGWKFTGDQGSDVAIGGDGEEVEETVLGLTWEPLSDEFKFRVTIRIKKGSTEMTISTLVDFREIIQSVSLTRRMVLANVARIFDPGGFLIPIILQAKLLMRESWCGEKLGWDDALPEELRKKWVDLLSSLLKLQDVSFPRSLWPDEEVVGLPSLVVFSDGSAVAYGAVAYIRWQLRKGGYWSRLIMAKGKIAPKGMTSIPRMELNGAVLGNRLKNFLMKETNIQFGDVYQLVDSSTVLGYIQKECGNFRPYEGIRVAEIQTAAVWKDGKLLGVFWVPGEFNPADWCTKPRRVEDLLSLFWQCGPEFMKLDVSSWPIKSTYKKDGLEGELKITRAVHAVIVNELGTLLIRLVHRYSSWSKVLSVG